MLAQTPLRMLLSRHVVILPKTTTAVRPLFRSAFRQPPSIRRAYSSVPPPPQAAQPPIPESEAARPRDLRSQFSSAPPVQQTQPLPKGKKSLRPYIYATLCFIFGSVAGSYVRLVIAPPPLPDAGTREDLLMVDFLHKQGENLPIVKSLSTDPAWEYHDAYTSLPEDARERRLTTGPLGGARAVGAFQRIFFNQDTGECVCVIWFGGALSGWPGVTHGGLVAIIMDEQLGRCAIRQFPSQTGVTANLNLTYLKPTVTNSFYVIRSFPVQEGLTETKAFVTGRLETLEGKVCVEAKGLFVVPKKYKTMVINDKY